MKALLFYILIFYSIYIVLSFRRQHSWQRSLMLLTDARRRLICLTNEDKLSVNSETFKLLYYVLEFTIRYHYFFGNNFLFALMHLMYKKDRKLIVIKEKDEKKTERKERLIMIHHELKEIGSSDKDVFLRINSIVTEIDQFFSKRIPFKMKNNTVTVGYKDDVLNERLKENIIGLKTLHSLC